MTEEYTGLGRVVRGVRRDKKPLAYSTADVSNAHTIGNVLAYVRSKILSGFREDYFHSVHTSTKIAFKHFNIMNMNNGTQYFRKRKPFLTIRPRIELNTDDAFLSHTLLTERFTDNGMVDRGSLQDVMTDARHGVYVQYRLQRYRVAFDVTMVVETPNEQMDLAYKLKNNNVWEKHITWGTHLESNIPRSIIAGVSYLTNIPMSAPADLLAHMNTYTNSAVTYKMKNSSGVDEYFYYYKTNIDAYMTNLSMDDGSRVNMVDDTYTVSYTIQCEFNGPGVYMIFSEHPLDMDLINMDIVHSHFDKEYSINYERGALELDILLTDLRQDYDIPTGWRLYSNPAYKISPDLAKDEPDILDLTKLFQSHIQEAIKYYLKNNIPIQQILQIDVYRDEKLLENEVDYVVDYQHMKLYTLTKNIHSNYRMIIMFNNLQLNTLLKDILDRETI